MRSRLLIWAAALTLSATAAQATEVLVISGPGQRSLGIAGSDPLGQTFTAIDASLLSFGFQIQTLNAGQANEPLTLTLLAGSGFNGATIATRTLTPGRIPTTRTPTWVDFDFTGTTLQAGQTYTALLTGSTNRYGLVYGPNINLSTGAATGPDAYAGGTIVASNGLSGICAGGGICDTNFRFSGTTVAAAVPEPGTWAMMLFGFGGIGFTIRRRRKLTNFAQLA